MNNKLLLLIICMSTLFSNLIHPPDGSELNYIHVMFQWNTVEGSTEYNFQLSSTNDFTSLLVSTSTSNLYYIEEDGIDWESNYYWRVSPIDAEWIDTFNFTTGESSVTFQNDDEPVEIQIYNS